MLLEFLSDCYWLHDQYPAVTCSCGSVLPKNTLYVGQGSYRPDTFKGPMPPYVAIDTAFRGIPSVSIPTVPTGPSALPALTSYATHPQTIYGITA